MHLIIGYGKWAKGIIHIIFRFKLFKKIIVINSKKKFILHSKFRRKEIVNRDFKKIKIKSVHIATPYKTHFKILKQYIKIKKIILEKPLFENVNQLKIIKNKIFLIGNYIDLYNSELLKFLKKIKLDDKIIRINLIYGSSIKNISSRDFLIDWLEHPLAVLNYILMKKIKNKKYNLSFSLVKNNNKFYISSKFKNINVSIIICNSVKRIRKIKLCLDNKQYDLNLLKNREDLNKKKTNNIVFLYKHLNFNKNLFFQKYSFYKKIIEQRIKILNLVNEKN